MEAHEFRWVFLSSLLKSGQLFGWLEIFSNWKTTFSIYDYNIFSLVFENNCTWNYPMNFDKFIYNFAIQIHDQYTLMSDNS